MHRMFAQLLCIRILSGPERAPARANGCEAMPPGAYSDPCAGIRRLGRRRRNQRQPGPMGVWLCHPAAYCVLFETRRRLGPVDGRRGCVLGGVGRERRRRGLRVCEERTPCRVEALPLEIRVWLQLMLQPGDERPNERSEVEPPRTPTSLANRTHERPQRRPFSNREMVLCGIPVIWPSRVWLRNFWRRLRFAAAPINSMPLRTSGSVSHAP